jgi:hypothetical protein
VHAGGGADNGGEKRSVLIVSVLLRIAIYLALRSNMQMRVDVLRVCQVAILQGVAATPITFMRDAEVKDQAPAASLVSQEVANLNVALPLALACRDSAPPGCGPCVQPCGREGQGPPPSSRAPWLHLSELCTCLCGRRESVQPACYGGGGEEPIVEVKNVSQSGGSKASLALEGRMVPGRAASNPFISMRLVRGMVRGHALESDEAGGRQGGRMVLVDVEERGEEGRNPPFWLSLSPPLCRARGRPGPRARGRWACGPTECRAVE